MSNLLPTSNAEESCTPIKSSASYLTSCVKSPTTYFGINGSVCINVAAPPAIVCAQKLWEMGSRNPVEIVQGLLVI